MTLPEPELVGLGLTLAELVGFAVTMSLFFVAQLITVWLFFRREKRQEAVRREAARKEQLREMKKIIDQDLGVIREDIRVVDNRHTRNYEHIKESRPTRIEMERNIQQLREVIETHGVAQQTIMAQGLEAINRRFDEFKEYMKDLQKK